MFWADGGRTIIDTEYDSRGLVYTACVLTGDPSGVLTTADDNQSPSQTLSTCDGAERILTTTIDQVSTAKDARGTTLGYSYDNLGRPLEVKNGTTPLTSMTYDTVPYAKGLPATSTRHIGNDKYVTAITGYDGLYSPKGTAVTIPASEGALAGTCTTTQSYDFNGSPLTASHPAVAHAAWITDCCGASGNCLSGLLDDRRSWGSRLPRARARRPTRRCGSPHRGIPTAKAAQLARVTPSLNMSAGAGF